MNIVRIISRQLVVLLALLPILVVFQNCGAGFKAGSDEEFTLLSVRPPAISITSAPAPLINTRTTAVTFAVTANKFAAVTRVTCAVDLNPAIDCTDRVDLTGLQDGDHAVIIIAEDSRGNISGETFVRFRVDATLPVVVINSGPPAVAGVATASIVFTATDNLSGLAAIECSYNNAAFAICASPQNFANLAQVAHSLRVRARDNAGNQSAEVTHSWRVDLTAPVITIATGPNNITNLRTATFTFTGLDDGVAITDFECQLDAGAFAACTSPQNYNNIADGTHTFNLRGRDTAGNQSAVVSRTWLVDATPPTVTFVATPQAITNQVNATFQFTGNDGAGSGVARTECSLDNAAFAVCTSPQNYTNLAGGAHNFRVQAVDNAGNTSNIATHNWTIDITPPVINLTATPLPFTNLTTAAFQFTAADGTGSGVARAECSLDNAAFAVCTSPQNYANIATGAHNFRLRATDNAGNTSDIITFNWTVESIPPMAFMIEKPDARTFNLNATFTFLGTDNSASAVRFECSLDNAAFTACTSPHNVTVATAGGHTLTVRAVDAAGNLSTPVEQFWQATPGPSIYSRIGLHTRQILYDNNRIFVAGLNAVTILDASNRTAPVQIGQYLMQPNGGSSVNLLQQIAAIAVSGNLMFVSHASNYTNIDVVDISNMASPRRITYFSNGLRGAAGMDINGNRLYVISDSLKIYDITTPGTPNLLSTTALNCTGGNGSGGNTTMPRTEFVGNLAYVFCGGSQLSIFNISTATPTLLSVFNLLQNDPEGAVRATALLGNTLYFAVSYGLTASGAILRAADVTNPAAPAAINNVNFALNGIPHDLKIRGANAYIALRTGLDVINVSNVNALSRVSSIASSGRVVASDGTYAYLGSEQGVDILDPRTATAVLVNRVNYAAIARDVILSGNLAIVANATQFGTSGTNSLDIFDVANPATPRLISSTQFAGSYARNLIQQGSDIYIRLASGFKHYNIANPSAPTLVGQYIVDSEFFNLGGLALSGSYLYTGYTSSFRIINNSNPAAPTLASSTVLPTTTIYDVKVQDSFAYVAAGTNGLYILNIANPSAPAIISQLDTPGTAAAVALLGNVAYVADGNSGIQVINITNPGAPTLITNFPSGRYMGGPITPIGNRLYYTGGGITGGLMLLMADISNPSAPTAIGGEYYIGAAFSGFAVRNNLLAVANDYGGLTFLADFIR